MEARGVRGCFAAFVLVLRSEWRTCGYDWLPADGVFPEEAKSFLPLSTLFATYELLEDNPCGHYLQGEFVGADQRPLYYLV